MNLWDAILAYLRSKQTAAPTPALPAAAPGLPVTPIVDALTSGGGIANQAKNATLAKQQILDYLAAQNL